MTRYNRVKLSHLAALFVLVSLTSFAFTAAAGWGGWGPPAGGTGGGGGGGGGGHAFGDTGELDALVFEVASTSGVRLDLAGGVLAVREGDDSAAADILARILKAEIGVVLKESTSSGMTVNNSRNGISLGSDAPVLWTSGQPGGTVDTSLDRISAGVVGVGKGDGLVDGTLAAGDLDIYLSGSKRMRIRNNGDIETRDTGQVAWSTSSTVGGSYDLFLSRESAGVLQVGATTDAADGTLESLDIVTAQGDTTGGVYWGDKTSSGRRLRLEAGGNMGFLAGDNSGGNFQVGAPSFAASNRAVDGPALRLTADTAQISMGSGNPLRLEHVTADDSLRIYDGTSTNLGLTLGYLTATGVVTADSLGTATALKLGTGSASTPAITFGDADSGLDGNGSETRTIVDGAVIFKVASTQITANKSIRVVDGEAFRIGSGNDVHLGGDGTTATLHVGSTDGGTDGAIRFQQEVENLTADNALAATETNKVFTNLGDAGTQTQTLPTGAVGLKFTFFVAAAFELRIDPAAGNKILDADMTGLVDAEYITANAVGESITLVGLSDGDWAVVQKHGTWTEETP